MTPKPDPNLGNQEVGALGEDSTVGLPATSLFTTATEVPDEIPSTATPSSLLTVQPRMLETAGATEDTSHALLQQILMELKSMKLSQVEAQKNGISAGLYTF